MRSGQLFTETSLKGNAIITSNNEEEDSRIDLEMLYKAIVTNKEAVHAAFK